MPKRHSASCDGKQLLISINYLTDMVSGVLSLYINHVRLRYIIFCSQFISEKKGTSIIIKNGIFGGICIINIKGERREKENYTKYWPPVPPIFDPPPPIPFLTEKGAKRS